MAKVNKVPKSSRGGTAAPPKKAGNSNAPAPASPPPAPASEPQVITKNDVGTVPNSLFGKKTQAQAGGQANGTGNALAKLNAALAVFQGDGLLAPSLFDAQADVELPQGGGTGRYVGFCSDRSTNWNACRAKGIAEGEPYVSVEGELVRCQTLKFMAFDGYACRVKVDSSYNIVGATNDLDDRTHDEYTIVLAVVFLEDGRLEPVKAEFMTTKAAMGRDMLQAVRDCQKPEWASASDLHRLAAQCNIPQARVTGFGTTARRIARTGPRAGQPYYLGQVACNPSTLTDIAKLAEAVADPDFMAAVQLVRDAMRPRLDAIAKYLNG
jgi:hypothetical protein